MGHIPYDCPLYKSEAKIRMKKVMMATWSESEEFSEEEKEKEVANMYSEEESLVKATLVMAHPLSLKVFY